MAYIEGGHPEHSEQSTLFPVSAIAVEQARDRLDLVGELYPGITRQLGILSETSIVLPVMVTKLARARPFFHPEFHLEIQDTPVNITLSPYAEGFAWFYESASQHAENNNLHLPRLYPEVTTHLIESDVNSGKQTEEDLFDTTLAALNRVPRLGIVEDLNGGTESSDNMSEECIETVLFEKEDNKDISGLVRAFSEAQMRGHTTRFNGFLVEEQIFLDALRAHIVDTNQSDLINSFTNNVYGAVDAKGILEIAANK